MSAPPIPDLVRALQRHFDRPDVTLHVLPDACAWSQTYAVVVNGQRCYLKGTPRSRPEAAVTQRLADHCTALLPAVLATDVLPRAPWCWFLTADAGGGNPTVLELDRAVQAALSMGTLQRRVQTDPWFAQHLPACQAEQLQHHALQLCRWLLQHGDADTHARVRRAQAALQQVTPSFQQLGVALRALPATCVHGDFWPGNIALQANGVRFLDWADAVWGVGGAAIWNLLETSDATLAHAHGAIWDAFSEGWEQLVSAAYIDAAYVAHLVTVLVVDLGFAAWHPADVDLVPGLLATVEQLTARIAG